MKDLVLKLHDIFKKASLGIMTVLAMDILEIVLLSLNPFVIGICIDNFWITGTSGFIY